MAEKWLPVKGHEKHYQVSSLGRVRRTMPAPGTRRGWILKQPLDTYGYRHVRLTVHGKGKTHNVHKLVAEAFLRKRPPGYTINHKDGCKTNNRVGNLEWCTRGENIAHCYALGLRKPVGNYITPSPGEKNGNAKISETTARKVLRLKGTATRKQLAKRLGVSIYTVANIHEGRTWKHIQQP